MEEKNKDLEKKLEILKKEYSKINNRAFKYLGLTIMCCVFGSFCLFMGASGLWGKTWYEISPLVLGGVGFYIVSLVGYFLLRKAKKVLKDKDKQMCKVAEELGIFEIDYTSL